MRFSETRRNADAAGVLGAANLSVRRETVVAAADQGADGIAAGVDMAGIAEAGGTTEARLRERSDHLQPACLPIYNSQKHIAVERQAYTIGISAGEHSAIYPQLSSNPNLDSNTFKEKIVIQTTFNRLFISLLRPRAIAFSSPPLPANKHPVK